MNLKDFVGTHMLSGVDREDDTNDAQAFRFKLDGKIYRALENPDDGYRSMLDTITLSRVKMTNTFSPVKVKCAMSVEDHRDVLQMRDPSGRLILEVGTDYSDDYYPIFVAYWSPEGLE